MSEPDVVSLETILADPPELTTTVARGLAFAGCLGFIHGPEGVGQDDDPRGCGGARQPRATVGGPKHRCRHGAGRDGRRPRSWTLALRDYGADTTRILMARARVVSRPGKLAALLAEHRLRGSSSTTCGHGADRWTGT